MKTDVQYIIQFKGLKEGVHEFTFSIDKPFFEAFEYLAVPDGQVDVTVVLEKKPTFLELNVSIKGEMEVQCDRCLEFFPLPVQYNGHLVVRFSELENESDEDVIWLRPDDYELDLRHYFYECLSLSIPIRKVHPDLPNGEPGCDPGMLKKLNEYLIK